MASAFGSREGECLSIDKRTIVEVMEEVWNEVFRDSKKGRISKESDLAGAIYHHLRSNRALRLMTVEIHLDWVLKRERFKKRLPKWLDGRRLDVVLTDPFDHPIVVMELKVFWNKLLSTYCKDITKLLYMRQMGSDLAFYCFVVEENKDYEWFDRRFTLGSLVKKCEGLQKTHDAFRKYEQNIESYLHIGRGFDSDYDSSWKLQPIQS